MEDLVGRTVPVSCRDKSSRVAVGPQSWVSGGQPKERNAEVRAEAVLDLLSFSEPLRRLPYPCKVSHYTWLPSQTG